MVPVPVSVPVPLITFAAAGVKVPLIVKVVLVEKLVDVVAVAVPFIVKITKEGADVPLIVIVGVAVPVRIMVLLA